MAQKTLISMERDRMRAVNRSADSSPCPDVPHSLSSVCLTPTVSQSFVWPVYQEPSRDLTFSNVSAISSLRSLLVTKGPISALTSCTIDNVPIDVCGADDGCVRYVNTDQSLMFQSTSHSSYISSLTFDDSSKNILTATGTGDISIASFRTYADSPSMLQVHSGAIWSVQVLDRALLTGSMDQTSRIIDLESEKVKQTFKGFHSDSINVAKFWNTQTVLTGSADKTLCLWDMRSGHKVSSWYNLLSDSPIIDICDLGQSSFACASTRGQISICDKDRVRNIFTISNTNVNKILRLSQNVIAIACDDGTIKFLNTHAGTVDSLSVSSTRAPILNISSRHPHSSLVATSSTGYLHVINFT